MSDDKLGAQLLALLERRLGIAASEGRAPGWLVSRLARAGQALRQRCGSSDVVAFLEAHPNELARLAELVRVGETRFFRDPEQWRALSLAASEYRGRRLRGLSAGCSTGEEAWTLAMVLRESMGQGFQVVGIDRSSTALEQARVALYPHECQLHIPEPYRTRYTQLTEESLGIHPDLKPSVRFVPRDVLEGPPPGSYELIVCKNLLIYLKPEAQAAVLRALFAALSPAGMLLVARAELGSAKRLGLPLQSLASGVTVVRAPE